MKSHSLSEVPKNKIVFYNFKKNYSPRDDHHTKSRYTQTFVLLGRELCQTLLKQLGQVGKCQRVTRPYYSLCCPNKFKSCCNFSIITTNS